MAESVEALFSQLGPFPMEAGIPELSGRKRQLDHIASCLDRLKSRLSAERQYLYSICDHADSYSSNTWGRDPGGGGCKTCGKVW